jgi:hypothetical protein
MALLAMALLWRYYGSIHIWMISAAIQYGSTYYGATMALLAMALLWRYYGSIHIWMISGAIQ